MLMLPLYTYHKTKQTWQQKDGWKTLHESFARCTTMVQKKRVQTLTGSQCQKRVDTDRIRKSEACTDTDRTTKKGVQTLTGSQCQKRVQTGLQCQWCLPVLRPSHWSMWRCFGWSTWHMFYRSIWQRYLTSQCVALYSNGPYDTDVLLVSVTRFNVSPPVSYTTWTLPEQACVQVLNIKQDKARVTQIVSPFLPSSNSAQRCYNSAFSLERYNIRKSTCLTLSATRRAVSRCELFSQSLWNSEWSSLIRPAWHS